MPAAPSSLHLAPAISSTHFDCWCSPGLLLPLHTCWHSPRPAAPAPPPAPPTNLQQLLNDLRCVRHQQLALGQLVDGIERQHRVLAHVRVPVLQVGDHCAWWRRQRRRARAALKQRNLHVLLEGCIEGHRLDPRVHLMHFAVRDAWKHACQPPVAIARSDAKTPSLPTPHVPASAAAALSQLPLPSTALPSVPAAFQQLEPSRPCKNAHLRAPAAPAAPPRGFYTGTAASPPGCTRWGAAGCCAGSGR